MSLVMEPLHSRTCAIFKVGDELKLFSQANRAQLYYRNRIHNLLNDEFSSIDETQLTRELESFKFDHDYDKPSLVICLYEFGEYIELAQVSEEQPLFIILSFDSVTDLSFDGIQTESEKFALKSEIERTEYLEKFESVMSHLKYGNAYQINLTANSLFSFESSIENIIAKFFQSKKLSEYAHCICLPTLDKVILSNSPECLFQKKGNSLVTRPIKGTVPEEEGEEALEKSLKDDSELNIITDLLRNDLSRIGKFYSKVLSKKSFLRVPGLIHQYSEIGVELESNVTLFDILRAIFPGGSITGAPKKRVVKLIKDIEGENRGFYTGSTILLYKDKIDSSINIRTAEISTKTKELKYGSGGGITLLSEGDSEYREMKNKLSSFINIFS